MNTKDCIDIACNTDIHACAAAFGATRAAGLGVLRTCVRSLVRAGDSGTAPADAAWYAAQFVDQYVACLAAAVDSELVFTNPDAVRDAVSVLALPVIRAVRARFSQGVMDVLMFHRTLAREIVREFRAEIRFGEFEHLATLTPALVDEFAAELCFKTMSENPHIPPAVLRKYAARLDWALVSECLALTPCVLEIAGRMLLPDVVVARNRSLTLRTIMHASDFDRYWTAIDACLSRTQACDIACALFRGDIHDIPVRDLLREILMA